MYMKKLVTFITGIFMSFQSIFANDVVTTSTEIKTPVTTQAPIENELVITAEEIKTLKIDSNKKKQGDFFYVTLSGFKEKPTLWFNATEYPCFEIIENQTSTVNSDQIQKQMFRALIPVENMTKPGIYSILAKSGDWEKKESVTILDNNKPISRITLSDSKSQIYATEKELDIVGSSLKTKTSKKLWNGKFIYPSTAPKSSPYGVKRSYNGGPVDSYHKGLDFAANKGAPVTAPCDGKVVAIGKVEDGFNVHGNTVILDHGHGVTSIYMHLSKINVTKAQDVKVGEKIGEVGHTGISSGPHLHWGVYLSGTSTDPEQFVKNSID